MGGCEIQRIAFCGDVEFGERHEEETAKCCAEECAVDGLKAAIWGGVDVQTAGAEEFDSLLPRYVVAADGQYASLVAEDTWARSKMLQLVLVCHLLDTWS